MSEKCFCHLNGVKVKDSRIPVVAEGDEGKTLVVEDGKYKLKESGGTIDDSEFVKKSEVSSGSTENTIPRRDDGGRIFVGSPTQDKHAVNKTYLDNSLKNVGKTYKHIISIYADTYTDSYSQKNVEQFEFTYEILSSSHDRIIPETPELNSSINEINKKVDCAYYLPEASIYLHSEFYLKTLYYGDSDNGANWFLIGNIVDTNEYYVENGQPNWNCPVTIRETVVEL